MGLFLCGCFSSTQSTKSTRPNQKKYTDVFSVNSIGRYKEPGKLIIHKDFKANFDLFIKDAKRYKKPNKTALVGKLKKIKYGKNNYFYENEDALALCSHEYQLKVDKKNSKLFKPKKHWLEIAIEKKRYNNFVAGDLKRAKYVLYHILFHCFYKEGHLPKGSVGIMEKDFYDSRDTVYEKSDAQLVEELFSHKSFDILPDNR